MRRIANWIARTKYGRGAVADGADLSMFKEKPSFTLKIGLFLLALSYLLGWPAVGAFGVAAGYFKEPLIVAIGGPAIYGFSWVVWWISIAITGKESLFYARAFNKWLTRRFIERFGDSAQGMNISSEGSINSASSSSSDIE